MTLNICSSCYLEEVIETNWFKWPLSPSPATHCNGRRHSGLYSGDGTSLVRCNRCCNRLRKWKTIIIMAISHCFIWENTLRANTKCSRDARLNTFQDSYWPKGGMKTSYWLFEENLIYMATKWATFAKDIITVLKRLDCREWSIMIHISSAGLRASAILEFSQVKTELFPVCEVLFFVQL